MGNLKDPNIERKLIYKDKTDDEFANDKTIIGLLYEKIVDMKLCCQLSKNYDPRILLNEACYRCTQIRLDSSAWAKVDRYNNSIYQSLLRTNNYYSEDRGQYFVMAMILVLNSYSLHKPRNWSKFYDKAMLYFNNHSEKDKFINYYHLLDDFVRQHHREAEVVDYFPHFSVEKYFPVDIKELTHDFDQDEIIKRVCVYYNKEDRLSVLDIIERAYDKLNPDLPF